MARRCFIKSDHTQNESQLEAVTSENLVVRFKMVLRNRCWTRTTRAWVLGLKLEPESNKNLPE
jgi:hypothetical protein